MPALNYMKISPTSFCFWQFYAHFCMILHKFLCKKLFFTLFWGFQYSVCGVQIHQTGYFLHTRISTLFVAIRHLSEARPRLKCTDGTKLRCTDLVPTSSRHHLHFKWRQRRVRAFPFLPPPFTDGPQLIRDR